jgi:diguanylate cyclase (GGDEF)-like protein
LKVLISNIRAPGLPVQGDGSRKSEFLEELPISIQQIRAGQTLHFYRKDHLVEVAGLRLTIPEYLPLRLDSTTRTIRVHEDGEGRELLSKLIEVAQSKKWQKRSAFILMDLNGLGITNTFRDGHTSGDQYLRQYAEVVQEHLREGLRKEDLFFRYAGDEFIIVMFRVTPKQVQKVMQRMSDRVFQSDKVNEVYLREKRTLIEMRESLNDIQDISDLEKLASTHEGLRDQMQSLGSTDLSLLKAEVTKFIDYNFSKLAGMRTGISTGIVMMDQGGSLQTYVTEASRQVKKAKSLYYFSSSPESEYNQSKYDYLTAEEKQKYAHRPGRAVKPIVLEPLALSR